jgi:hypothetical protein
MTRREWILVVALVVPTPSASWACKSNDISVEKPCATGQYNCHGDTLQVCNADQSGWDDLKTCPPGTCLQGASQCGGSPGDASGPWPDSGNVDAASDSAVPDASDAGADSSTADGACPSSWMVAPGVDPTIAVPDGGGAVLLHSFCEGAQNYKCTATASDGGPTYAWSFVGPDAVMVDCKGNMFGHHFASDGGPNAPEWQITDSFVIGSKLAAVSPDASAVPWLLLQETAHGGAGVLSRAAYIQRVNTTGGLAPTTTCAGGNVGMTSGVNYTADYYFFGQ